MIDYHFVVTKTSDAVTVYICTNLADAKRVTKKLKLRGGFDYLENYEGALPKEIRDFDNLIYETASTVPELYKTY